MRFALAIAAAVALAACATSGESEAPAGPLSLVVAPGEPVPAQGRFYADCITQSIQQTGYDREGNVIRFHCDGAVAQRFYDGLAAWSAEIGSEYEGDGATWRFTTTISENPSFRDFCKHSRAHYTCTVVLNVGEFLAE